MLKRPRVLLADDHQMLVDALRRVLEPRCEVVGTVGDGRALLEAAAKLQPDIVVVDIGMPELNGLDAARQLRRTLPKVKLIFLTMNQDPYLVGEAFRAGASAFLMKQAAALELTDAIEQVPRRDIGGRRVGIRGRSTVLKGEHVGFRCWRELLIIGNVGSRKRRFSAQQIRDDLVFGFVGCAADLLVAAERGVLRVLQVICLLLPRLLD